MRIALALILVAGFAATANADVYTWFTTTADATEAAALQGTDLVIEHNPPLGAPETIRVYQWLAVDGVDLIGYDCDLAYGDASGFFAISDMDSPGQAGWLTAEDGSGDATGWYQYGALDLWTTSPLADGVYPLANFDLTINYTGIIETHSILAGIGANEWADPAGAPFSVFFGDDTTPISSSDVSTFSEVITVSCVPEPTTLALLGFGALALIRRR